ncbi:MAG: glutaminyl-peptide cyclotransferase [Sinimarinibacterium flocculans]|uniref:glutaminyl-peptide cyclotransferase n=1 Tax=Sinimarinibacterium flocculans TaxID=985250 RepID=UPI003C67A30C
MTRTSFAIALVVNLFFVSSCVANEDVRTLDWRIVATLPHDTRHFTQGLVLHDDWLVETSGHYGRSALIIKSRATGETVRARALPQRWFAEGATVWNDRIVMLTWREQIAQWFDWTLQPIEQMRFDGEGWGITHDGRSLITSNGSSSLQFRRPEDFSIVREVHVTDRGVPVTRLNELEFARGLVFANVWLTDRIAVIDPASGQVRAWLDLAALKQAFELPANWSPTEHVLNGIAHDARSDRFYVTGKSWPALFEIEVGPVAPAK